LTANAQRFRCVLRALRTLGKNKEYHMAKKVKKAAKKTKKTAKKAAKKSSKKSCCCR